MTTTATAALASRGPMDSTTARGSVPSGTSRTLPSGSVSRSIRAGAVVTTLLTPAQHGREGRLIPEIQIHAGARDQRENHPHAVAPERRGGRRSGLGHTRLFNVKSRGPNDRQYGLF